MLRKLINAISKWWQRLSFSRRSNFVLGLLSLFVTSYLLGWYIGRSASPDFDTPGGVRIFIAQNFRIRSHGDDTTLFVSLSNVTYVYSLKADVVSVETPSPAQIRGSSPPRRNFLRDQEKILALAGIGALPAGAFGGGKVLASIGTASDLARRAVIITVTLVAVTGGALGYRLGYDGAPDVNSEAFFKAIRDPGNWRSFALTVQHCDMKRITIFAMEKLLAEQRKSGDPKDLELFASNARVERATGRQCLELLAWYERSGS